MGKDLHYSIRPFIERALRNHNKVSSVEVINDDEYYAYKVNRINHLRDVIVVLSDAYRPYGPDPDNHLFNFGGFFLIARPEADEFLENDYANRIITGKLAILLGALHKDEFWEYKPAEKKKEK